MLVWSYLYYGIIFLFWGFVLESFEVKVLLHKIKKSDLVKESIKIESSYGFITSRHATLSVGKKYPKKQLEIKVKHDTIFVGDTPLQNICYVMPLLSRDQHDDIKNLVYSYFKNHEKKLCIHGEVLTAFFDHFINKKCEINQVCYEQLTCYVEQIIRSFLQNMVLQADGFEDVMSLDTLLYQAHTFIKDRIKVDFLQLLAAKKLEKKDRKLLEQNAAYRYDFFIHHVHMVIENLLQEFLLVLPSKIIGLLHHNDSECLSYEGNQYRGKFAVLLQHDTVYIINCLDIDDYLLSVIRHEGWPGWPLEVNKLLAIVCRTYLVWQVLQAQKMKRPYHIENGIRHQTYKGHHKYMRLKQAVDDTKDICIAINGKPILAMFDACCGGIVPAHIEQSPDFKKHEYLLRKQPCIYCKNCKIATWKVEISYEDVLAILQKEIPSLVSFDTMYVAKRDKAGLVKEVAIITKDTKLYISGKKMYSLFHQIKSFCFDIESLPKNKRFKNGNNKTHKNYYNADGKKRFIITGKGYGHHIGLCQWGAMKLVKDYHWNYQKILEFYYPGTHLIRLDYKR